MTSTGPTTSIEDGWKHEMYTKFWKAKTKGRGASFWWPVWGPIIFEQGVLGGKAVWLKMFLGTNARVQVEVALRIKNKP